MVVVAVTGSSNNWGKCDKRRTNNNHHNDNNNATMVQDSSQLLAGSQWQSAGGHNVIMFTWLTSQWFTSTITVHPQCASPTNSCCM
jgi:hypothetical protein